MTFFDSSAFRVRKSSIFHTKSINLNTTNMLPFTFVISGHMLIPIYIFERIRILMKIVTFLKIEVLFITVIATHRKYFPLKLTASAILHGTSLYNAHLEGHRYR